ncbi:thiol-disulfide oxidoreductase ResA [Neobacillus thermocopriae]|uniref:Thiol-disulfide oxidoreductase ResA n=1 Tax=Neobacillus thermocopriae TaxID=1215031 RepID=A0A6B3TSW2_9BACI|nr:thiol-disulfide oxidoreductase ResA [Neobacillus thermocopriae]MED3624896.1 thiol-disulfide oxidoreductase ResA [Neobacillus thermocopriae]MED3713925.1 thiol-disulfide oxidoreductase ResA [Neobacillus thermocopriae]NEX79923.1 thiol-disulfide oxidoreductase ResA [Neobacillus thermocopriae]
MKKRRLVTRTIILLVLGAAVVYTLYANFTKDSRLKVDVGDQAPDFVLIDMDGNKHQLSDYRGQGVFLNFWGTWCPPCKKEMPYINNQYNQFKDQGVQVLSVDIQESELVVNQFVEQYKLDFPIMIDKDKEVMTAYGVDLLPATFLIDKNGKVVKYHTGELTEDKVREFMESIKP